MKKILACVLIATCVTAFAADSTIRMPNGNLVHVGDSEGRVLSRAGQPTEIINLVNDYNAPVGKKLVYKQTGYNAKTIVIYINSAGTVGNVSSFKP